ncbi:MAG: hypothetical protein P8I38_10975 [Arenicella sp.]|nr:hypothetical protein [Arenicella sp.]
MFGKGENYSTQRIVDPVSGVRVPVVLNPKMEIADPQLPARERVNLYVRFIKAQGTRYCLFTPTGLKVSRVAGVSLSSQIEHMAVVYQLEDETIIAQFGQTYYLANLASGFVIREELVPIEQFDSNDLGQNEVIALQGVKSANEMGIRIIDATLLLRGRGVTKAHLFQTETKAFSAAGYRHPAQIRRLIISVVLILTLLVSLYFYRAYQSEQERIEQQKRAAVIPPKVGKDSSVEQLRVYASWLEDHLEYYLNNGLTLVEIGGGEVKLHGNVKQQKSIQFYDHHKLRGVLPSYQVALSAANAISTESENQSTWSVKLVLGRDVPSVSQFGLEVYENYLVTMQSALPRLGFSGSSQTPALNAYGIKEGEINIVGEYNSTRSLYELANLMIGIPSYTQALRLSFDGPSSVQINIQMRLVGRG